MTADATGDPEETCLPQVPVHLEFKVILWAHLVYFLFAALRGYFGGYRELWKDHPDHKGMSSTKLGQKMLWVGEMRNGKSGIVLSYLVASALFEGQISLITIDVLLLSHLASVGILLGTAGPCPIVLLSLMLNAHSWLIFGFWFTLGQFASSAAWFVGILLLLFGCCMNVFDFRRHVFGVQTACCCCSRRPEVPAESGSKWSFEAYRDALREVERHKEEESCWQGLIGLLWHSIDSDRIAVDLLENLCYRGSSLHPGRQLRQDCGNQPCFCGLLSLMLLMVGPMYARTWMVQEAWHDTGECSLDTGGTCTVLPCLDQRNAKCNFTYWPPRGRCICGPYECAVDGMCVPNPEPWFADHHGAGGGAAGAPLRAPQRALVLSGGGAKAAWMLGVLQALCNSSSSTGAAGRRGVFQGWTRVLGTSIGALTAAFLAQFPADQQCSKALPAMAAFWASIESDQDMWQSPTEEHFDNFEHSECLSITQAWATFTAFGARGGFCDPRPGVERFLFEVDRQRIRDSGMQLNVVATRGSTGEAIWWDQSSEDILNGTLASGAIAPLVYPQKLHGELFLDGGLVCNTPLLKALENGADEVLVILLDPLETPSLSPQGPEDRDLGAAVVEFEIRLFIYKYFIETELVRACTTFSSASIYGYSPEKAVGSLMDFTPPQIEAMRLEGYRAAMRSPPIDLCAWLRQHQAAWEPLPTKARPPPRFHGESLLEEATPARGPLAAAAAAFAFAAAAVASASGGCGPCCGGAEPGDGPGAGAARMRRAAPEWLRPGATAPSRPLLLG